MLTTYLSYYCKVFTIIPTVKIVKQNMKENI